MDKKKIYPLKVRNAHMTLSTLNTSNGNDCLCFFWIEAFQSGEQIFVLFFPAKANGEDHIVRVT